MSCGTLLWGSTTAPCLKTIFGLDLCDIQNNQGWVGVISLSLWLWLIIVTESLNILNITKTELNNCLTLNFEKMVMTVNWLFISKWVKIYKSARNTWLPLGIMHCIHTRHDYLWPGVSLTCDYCIYCIICG